MTAFNEAVPESPGAHEFERVATVMASSKGSFFDEPFFRAYES